MARALRVERSRVIGPVGVSVRVAAGEPVEPRSVRDREDSEIEFSRVVAFSDGVFAIAITLLVLALEIPAGVDDLGQALRDRGDEFFAYGLSFAVMASLWIDHHRFFGALERFDGRLMALNLLYLAFVALVPFTSEPARQLRGPVTGGDRLRAQHGRDQRSPSRCRSSTRRAGRLSSRVASTTAG